MNNHFNKHEKRVAIVGGGLVGSLNACYFAKRGYEVDLYEYRSDIRQSQHARGRSINLALSVRGLAALQEVGLKDAILDHGIPMYARMIHDLDGRTHPIPYGTDKQCIYSVGRRYLNEVILNAAEKYPNVHCNFEHKLIHANLKAGDMTFSRPDKSQTGAKADLIVGCDGAFSSVRRLMLKEPHFNFSQKYIEHRYLELCMPPTKNGNFAMAVNYLHIWPRGDFMMIALPNQDRTYTVTLFMPAENFQKLDNSEKLLRFFGETFPDAVPLIGESQLVKDFFSLQPSFLLTVKCFPYHVGDSAVIMGDAAHAMVPFYGQGMNCGFEDCLIFDKFLNDNHDKIGQALRQFSDYRNPDAEAICDLALYNYLEMRHLVNTRAFIVRKYVDRFLHWCMPNIWIPLYTTVTFSRKRYHLCVENRKWQNKVLSRVRNAFLVAAAAVSLGLGLRYGNQHISYLLKILDSNV